MRNQIVLCVLWFVAIAMTLPPTAQAEETPDRILFIGNSYTSGVRKVLQYSLARTPRFRTTRFEFHTPGGVRLGQHLKNGKLMQKIRTGKWDYVVLQEQSQIPSFPPPQSNMFLEPAAELCKIISDSGATPVFFMTWGRRDGDKDNIQFNSDFETMQKRLSQSYRTAAKQGNARLIPAGEVFAAVKSEDPQLFRALYTGDGSHPSGKAGVLFVATFLHHLWGDEIKVVPPRTITTGELATIKKAVAAVKNPKIQPATTP